MMVPAWLLYFGGVLVIWIAISGRWSPQQLAWALLAAALTLPFTWEILDLRRKVALFRLFRRVLGFWLAFFGLFLPDAFRSSIDMARRIVQPVMPLYPGIVSIPFDPGGPLDTLLYTNHLTLTPGQFVLDFDPKGHKLYLHAIDARDRDKIRREAQKLHRQARRWMRV